MAVKWLAGLEEAVTELQFDVTVTTTALMGQTKRVAMPQSAVLIEMGFCAATSVAYLLSAGVTGSTIAETLATKIHA